MKPIIQHKKIASFQPLWAEFTGYSFILEGVGVPSADSAYDFSRAVDTMAAFDTLAEGIASFGTQRLMGEALLCLLDPATFHVTAVDLINDDNVTRIELGPLSTTALRDLANMRTGSADMPDVLTRLGMQAQAETYALRFRYGGIDLTSTRAVMVRMEADDDATKTALERLRQWRCEIGKTVLNTIGLKQKELNPHLTLGYFANEKRAKRASSVIKQLDAHLASKMLDQTFTFDRASLYGFTSMERFVRITE